MQAVIHEIELGRLRLKAREVENTLAELNRAMASHLVATLPMHPAIVRRYAECEQQLRDVGRKSSEELQSIIDYRAREHLCGVLCERMRYRQLRADMESSLSELISLGASASFRQG